MKKEKPKSYCEHVEHLEKKNLDKIYHDKLYGFPVKNDDQLFGRLILEINQAGLSWTTILKKQDNFKQAFSNFEIKKIAKYKQKEISRLLNDCGIVRNKRKIDSVIYNAQIIIELQKEFGSFKLWLDSNHPLDREDWVKLFKKNFKFTGYEITNEFLTSTGYLKGAHLKNCPIFEKILKKHPRWNISK